MRFGFNSQTGSSIPRIHVPQEVWCELLRRREEAERAWALVPDKLGVDREEYIQRYLNRFPRMIWTVA